MTTRSISIPGIVYSVDDAVNQVGYGVFQIRLTILAGLGWLADSFEIFILSVIGDFLACEWTLYRWQIALLTSIVFAGIMVGSPILGTIADVYGRKKSLAISMVLLFCFGAVSAASPSYTWMVIFRTCMGFSLGGIAQGVTLNSEYCPTNVRGKAGFYLCVATRGLLATDHVILSHGQVTWTTPELAPPLLITTPHQREDVSALDRFNVHRCPTRRVFSGTGIELMTCLPCQMNSLAASVKLTYSASMVDRLTDFCLKVRHEIGVSSIKVMNPPIDTRSSLFVAKSESE
ncbi:synaptic vesicle 2-related protein [Trichonephila clavipes]|uniref:Synaptic vesicle 2-related protein n=1 Tax=Trichonephila clavipes TaxID=2585209 RepID=A0A8X6SHB0_TRICX|nr:synaptic vesicle 2-related protein [Trichonephila clavipes]